MMATFFELYKDGKVTMNDIDDYIDEWHESDGEGPKLHEFLGMSWEEYATWVSSNIFYDSKQGSDELNIQSGKNNQCPLYPQWAEAAFKAGRDK